MQKKVQNHLIRGIFLPILAPFAKKIFWIIPIFGFGVKTTGKILILLFAVLIIRAIPAVDAGNDNIHSLTTLKARLPIYNKDRLQFFVYCQRLQRQANRTDAQDAIIDIIRNGVNVDNIKYLDGAKPYPLGAPVAQVLDFWKDKLHSDGLIMTSVAA